MLCTNQERMYSLCFLNWSIREMKELLAYVDFLSLLNFEGRNRNRRSVRKKSRLRSLRTETIKWKPDQYPFSLIELNDHHLPWLSDLMSLSVFSRLVRIHWISLVRQSYFQLSTMHQQKVVILRRHLRTNLLVHLRICSLFQFSDWFYLLECSKTLIPSLKTTK